MNLRMYVCMYVCMYVQSGIRALSSLSSAQ